MIRDYLTVYPNNLIFQALSKKRNMDNIYIKGFYITLLEFDAREKEILELRYKYKKTFEQIAEMFNVTRERIRQIERKAIRKLKHKEYNFIGISLVDHAKAIREYDSRIDELYRFISTAKICVTQEEADKVKVKDSLITPIEEMDFSVRAYNCLKRAGIHTLSDLSKKTTGDILKIRNLGRKSVEEIITKAKKYGINIEWGEEKL